MPQFIQFNGKKYPAKELDEEAVVFGDMLAENMKLEGTPSPLELGADYTLQEQRAIREQINAMTILPPFGTRTLWAAFSAKHLSKVAKLLRANSFETPTRVGSVVIQVLSSFDFEEPRHNPYYRRFLSSDHCTKKDENGAALPTHIARAVLAEDITKLPKPLTAGHVCSMLMNVLQWCPPSVSDDGLSCINRTERLALVQKMKEIQSNPATENLDRKQQVEIDRFIGMIGCADTVNGPSGAPDGFYFDSMRDHLLGRFEDCDGNDCEEEPTLRCSGCKVYRFCGKECQKWHWNNGHKLMCFKTDF